MNSFYLDHCSYFLFYKIWLLREIKNVNKIINYFIRMFYFRIIFRKFIWSCLTSFYHSRTLWKNCIYCYRIFSISSNSQTRDWICKISNEYRFELFLKQSKYIHKINFTYYRLAKFIIVYFHLFLNIISFDY